MLGLCAAAPAVAQGMGISDAHLRVGDVPADEASPADRYVVADRPIGAGQLIPALDGSSKDAGDLLVGAFPRIDPSTQALRSPMKSAIYDARSPNRPSGSSFHLRSMLRTRSA